MTNEVTSNKDIIEISNEIKKVLTSEKKQERIFLSHLDKKTEQVMIIKLQTLKYGQHNDKNSFYGFLFEIYATSLFEDKIKLPVGRYDIITPIGFVIQLREKNIKYMKEYKIKFKIISQRICEITEIP